MFKHVLDTFGHFRTFLKTTLSEVFNCISISYVPSDISDNFFI